MSLTFDMNALAFVKEADMSYADDNAPVVCSENFDVTLKTPEEEGKILFEMVLRQYLKRKC